MAENIDIIQLALKALQHLLPIADLHGEIHIRVFLTEGSKHPR